MHSVLLVDCECHHFQQSRSPKLRLPLFFAYVMQWVLLSFPLKILLHHQVLRWFRNQSEVEHELLGNNVIYKLLKITYLCRCLLLASLSPLSKQCCCLLVFERGVDFSRLNNVFAFKKNVTV